MKGSPNDSPRESRYFEPPLKCSAATHRISGVKEDVGEHGRGQRIRSYPEYPQRPTLGHQKSGCSCTFVDCGKVFHRRDLLIEHLNHHETQEKTFSYAESASRSSSASSVSRTPALTIASIDSETKSTIYDPGLACYPSPIVSDQWGYNNEFDVSCQALLRQTADLIDTKQEAPLLSLVPDRTISPYLSSFSPALSSYSRSSRWSAASTWSTPAVPPQEWVTQERSAKGDTEPERVKHTPVNMSLSGCQKKPAMRSPIWRRFESMKSEPALRQYISQDRVSTSRSHEQTAEQRVDWPPRFVNLGGDSQEMEFFGSPNLSTLFPSQPDISQNFVAARPSGESQPRLIVPLPEPQQIDRSRASSNVLHSSGRIHHLRGYQHHKPSELFHVSKDDSKDCLPVTLRESTPDRNVHPSMFYTPPSTPKAPSPFTFLPTSGRRFGEPPADPLMPTVGDAACMDMKFSSSSKDSLSTEERVFKSQINSIHNGLPNEHNWKDLKPYSEPFSFVDGSLIFGQYTGIASQQNICRNRLSQKQNFPPKSGSAKMEVSEEATTEGPPNRTLNATLEDHDKGASLAKDATEIVKPLKVWCIGASVGESFPPYKALQGTTPSVPEATLGRNASTYTAASKSRKHNPSFQRLQSQKVTLSNNARQTMPLNRNSEGRCQVLSEALSPESNLSSVASPNSSTNTSDSYTEDDLESLYSNELGDDESDIAVYRELYNIIHYRSSGDEGNNLMKPMLSPMKRALVDRIMEDFWVIFDEGWAANVTKCTGRTPTSSAAQGTFQSLAGSSSSPSGGNKRRRDGDFPPDENDDGTPKRLKPRVTSPKDREIVLKLACPFRKHNPRTYGVQNCRSCALSCWDTVARVKEHLYRRHRVPIQCKRCWQLFKTQDALESHVRAIEICLLRQGRPAEGITSDIEKKLRSRKKSSPDQSEEDRWREIYRLLFPNEVVPMPYFEPVQDDAAQSPDSLELANYEEFSRRELPLFFRSCLEEVVYNKTRPLEDWLKGHLVSMIRDCQDRVFSAYKASKQMSPGGIQPYDNKEAEVPIAPLLASDSVYPTFDPSESNNVLLPMYQPLPHQPQRQHGPDLWDIEGLNAQSRHTGSSTFSDSGYSTNRLSCACSGQCCCSRSNFSLSNGTSNPSISDMERPYNFMNPGSSSFDQGNGSSSDPFDPNNPVDWWNTP